MEAPAEAPGPCLRHGVPGMMRFQAVRDPSVLLDLCMECFQLYAMATVHDEPALAQLHRLARVSRGEVWRSGSAFYLLRGQASNA